VVNVVKSVFCLEGKFTQKENHLLVSSLFHGKGETLMNVLVVLSHVITINVESRLKKTQTY